MKKTLAEAIKGMQVKSWEMREHSDGKRVVYVRFAPKEPTLTVNVGSCRARRLGSLPSLRHSSVRLHSGDSLARTRTEVRAVTAHAHRMPCRAPGVPCAPRRVPRPLRPLRLLRSSRYALRQPDACGTGESRLGSSR